MVGVNSCGLPVIKSIISTPIGDLSLVTCNKGIHKLQLADTTTITTITTTSNTASSIDKLNSIDLLEGDGGDVQKDRFV